MAETETTTLYDTDILLWSEQQAELLRQRLDPLKRRRWREHLISACPIEAI
jgi:hypothetical protein